MFLADKSVIPRLTALLGKKKNVPVPLDLNNIDWTAQIERARFCAFWCLGNWSPFVVRVADVSFMSLDDINDNVIAACNGIAHALNGNWDNWSP